MRLKLGDQTWGRMPVTLAADQSLRQARGESAAMSHGELDCVWDAASLKWRAGGLQIAIEMVIRKQGLVPCNKRGTFPRQTMRCTCCMTV